MRIGIDARFFGPDSKGLGRYTQKLITYLEDIDNENDYVIFLRRDNFDLYVPKNPRFTKVLADYQWYSFGEQFFFPFVLYKSKCDLVHFLHFNVPVLYVKKFIVTIHDLILLRYPTKKATTRNPLFYWFKFLLYRFVIASALRRAKHVIAVSDFTKDDICTQYPYACEKTTVIYESAEIAEQYVFVDTEKILRECGIINKYMLYVGNAYPHKNLYSLVDAFALCQCDSSEVSHLVLVGKKDHFYCELEKYIATKNILHITILYTVGDDVLDALYKNASIFVFPSLYEGFGLPPLEAQSYGVPVVSSDHACMKEVLSDVGAKYCDAENISDLAHAIGAVSSDDLLKKKLIAQGYQNVMRYSWKKMAGQIYNLYKTM